MDCVCCFFTQVKIVSAAAAFGGGRGGFGVVGRGGELVVIFAVIVFVIIDISVSGEWLINETLLHASLHSFFILATVLFVKLGSCGVSW